LFSIDSPFASPQLQPIDHLDLAMGSFEIRTGQGHHVGHQVAFAEK